MHYLSLDLNAVISFVLFPSHLGAKYEFEYIAIGHFNFYHKSKLECGNRVVTPPPPPLPPLIRRLAARYLRLLCILILEAMRQALQTSHRLFPSSAHDHVFRGR